jgi:hypothetical protein
LSSRCPRFANHFLYQLYSLPNRRPIHWHGVKEIRINASSNAIGTSWHSGQNLLYQLSSFTLLNLTVNLSYLKAGIDIFGEQFKQPRVRSNLLLNLTSNVFQLFLQKHFEAGLTNQQFNLRPFPF